MYNIGDKVKIRSKEWFKKNCMVFDEINKVLMYKFYGYSISLTSEMMNFENQIVTINNIRLILSKPWSTYTIDEDNLQYVWQEWMFESPLNGVIKKLEREENNKNYGNEK